MNDPKIVASSKNQQRSSSTALDSSRSWLVLGWIGLAFLIVGGADFVLTWIPPNFGDQEWQFATVTQSFNGLPILLLGLGLLIVASDQVDRRWWATLGTIVAGGLLLWVLLGVFLWSMNVSLALELVPDELEVGVRRAVARTVVQSVTYPVALAYLVWKAWVAGRGTGVESA